jgi:ABC-2 type transport system permease protein
MSQTGVNQGRLFWQLRWAILRNTSLQLVGTSKVRIVTMILASAIIWAFLFVGSWWGFDLIARNRIPPRIVLVIFDAMFFTFGVMLLFSTGIILYSSLFNSPETRFLLTTPARADQVFATKFQAAVGFSSWAFVVLASPILIAFGITYGVYFGPDYVIPWYFYALLPIFFLGYVLLPGSLGAVICLAIVNLLPQRRKSALIVFFMVIGAVASIWIYRAIVLAQEAARSRDSLQSLFDMFAITQSEFNPGHWVSTGLMAAARGNIDGIMLPLALLWSNGLMLYLVAAWGAGRWYRRGYNRIATGGDLRRKRRGTWPDQLLSIFIWPLSRNMQLLIRKDFRSFRRDPAQMAQLLIFAGLVLLCVINVRQFYGADVAGPNQQSVSLLNLFASAMLMCAFLGRFVYPLISMEGRKFWILGLLPLKRQQLLWGKYVFAVIVTSLFGMSMVLISDLFLGMPLIVIALHTLAVILLSTSLSGMTVGLSAWLPNFRETDPSKIAVGFGGTVNMITCLLLLSVIIAATSLPYHLSVSLSSFTGGKGDVSPLVFLGVPLAIVMSIAAIWIPMRLGRRTLDNMEF